MSLQFQCPTCNTLLSTSTGKPGSIVTCGVCHNDMVVPNVAPPVALAVPTTPVVFLPHIDTERLRVKRPQRGMSLPLELLTVGVIGLLLAVVVGLIYFNLPSEDGHQGNGAAAVKQKAKVQVGNRPAAVRPKAKLQAQPGESGKRPFDLDGEAVGGLSDEHHVETAAIVIVLIVVIVGLGLLLHFLPTFIAAMRGHQNTAAIAVLNLLLGWTFIGWVAALVWSFTEVRSREHRHYHR